jgi:hypothetical protein
MHSRKNHKHSTVTPSNSKQGLRLCKAGAMTLAEAARDYGTTTIAKPYIPNKTGEEGKVQDA